MTEGEYAYRLFREYLINEKGLRPVPTHWEDIAEEYQEAWEYVAITLKQEAIHPALAKE